MKPRTRAFKAAVNAALLAQYYNGPETTESVDRIAAAACIMAELELTHDWVDFEIAAETIARKAVYLWPSRSFEADVTLACTQNMKPQSTP